MQNLQTIKHPQFGELSIIIINDKEYFKAKEAATMLGYKDTINAIKQHCKGVVKHHLLTKGGKQEVSLIPEGDLWRLIIRSKLPQAESIEKWIMEEVLPTIRKTGTYTYNKNESEPKQLELYSYFDKYYNGVAVMTSSDVAHFTGLDLSRVRTVLKYMTEGKDYYKLGGIELGKFKYSNPKYNKVAGSLLLITASGFAGICRYYNIQIETPKVFLETEKTEECYYPYEAMVSLMCCVQRDTSLITEYYKRLLDTSSFKEAEANRQGLINAIRSLRGYVIDIKTISLKK